MKASANGIGHCVTMKAPSMYCVPSINIPCQCIVVPGVGSFDIMFMTFTIIRSPSHTFNEYQTEILLIGNLMFYRVVFVFCFCFLFVCLFICLFVSCFCFVFCFVSFCFLLFLLCFVCLFVCLFSFCCFCKY